VGTADLGTLAAALRAAAVDFEAAKAAVSALIAAPASGPSAFVVPISATLVPIAAVGPRFGAWGQNDSVGRSSLRRSRRPDGGDARGDRGDRGAA